MFSNSPRSCPGMPCRQIAVSAYCNVLFICLFALRLHNYLVYVRSRSLLLPLSFFLFAFDLFAGKQSRQNARILHRYFVNILPQIQNRIAIVVRGEPRPAHTLRMLNACKINERFCGFGPQGQHGTGRQAQMSSDRETDRQAGRPAGRCVGVWAWQRLRLVSDKSPQLAGNLSIYLRPLSNNIN